MSNAMIEGLKFAKTVLKPVQVVLSPLSVVTGPVRRTVSSVVTPVTDFLIEEVGSAMGLSKQTRELAKAIASGAVDITTGCVVGEALFDEETWDSAIHLLEVLNQPGADGSYAWSPS